MSMFKNMSYSFYEQPTKIILQISIDWERCTELQGDYVEK